MSTGAITIPNLAGDIRFSCKDKKLMTDFSKFNNPEASFISEQNYHAFEMRQSSVMPLVTFEYALASQRSTLDGSILPRGVTIELLARGFKKVSGIRSVDFSGSDPKEAVFVLDSRRNVLVPAYYNGQADTNKIKNVTVGDRLDLYYAPDYTAKTGWRKLSIDLKNSLIWTEDVGMPNFKVAN